MFVIALTSPKLSAYLGSQGTISMNPEAARKFTAYGDAQAWIEGEARRQFPGVNAAAVPFTDADYDAFARACGKAHSIPCCYPKGGGAHAPDPEAEADPALVVHQPGPLLAPPEAGGCDPATAMAPGANGHAGRVA